MADSERPPPDDRQRDVRQPSEGGMERHTYDVVVIGAGGAGLRAAIAAHEAGARTAIVCKSLLGKAHTVMAEGGIAAAMGNRWPEDNWEVHFRDTMRGGKMLNNWRMAQLHAQEAPERVQELEDWGALFDRTEDGLISQRDFGGHRYARLAHVGDRTGLEMIRTLQQRAVAARHRRVHGVHGHRPAQGRTVDKISGAFGYWRETGRFVVFDAPDGDPRDRRHRQVVQGHLELLGVHRRRPRPRAARRRLADQHGVRAVPPDRHGLAAVGEGAAGHRVGARRRRHPEELRGQAVHVRLHPGVLQGARPPTPRRRPTGWYDDKKNNRRPPELLPRDEVARAINSEIKAGRGSPHGGIFLDIASRRTPEFIRKRLPSMYHQFKELADVDITAEPMEIGPTCHYVMGGVEVDADTQESAVTGLYAVGECSGGMHGSNRLGGNSLGDLLVFGKRAGEAAAAYAAGARRDPARRSTRTTSRRPQASALAPFEVEGGGEPVHDPAGPPAVDERPGRHHPHRRRARAVAGGDRGVQGARQARWSSRGTGSTTRAGTSRSTCATC